MGTIYHTYRLLQPTEALHFPIKYTYGFHIILTQKERKLSFSGDSDLVSGMNPVLVSYLFLRLQSLDYFCQAYTNSIKNLKK